MKSSSSVLALLSAAHVAPYLFFLKAKSSALDKHAFEVCREWYESIDNPPFLSRRANRETLNAILLPLHQRGLKCGDCGDTSSGIIRHYLHSVKDFARCHV